jgi:sulfatase modifying factor 1
VEKQSRSPRHPALALASALLTLALSCAPTAGVASRSEPAVASPLSLNVGLSATQETEEEGHDEAACPGGMVLIDGMACPNLQQACVRWVDPPTSAFPFTRCAEFKRPATCQGGRVHRRYCIDQEEYLRVPETLPLVNVSWEEAQATCEEQGARLCSESEWEFACEGEEMLPYPYGFERDSTACNFDRTDLGKMEDGLNDLRAPPDAFPRCVSPFGVHDMVGNVDEWTEREGMAAPNRSALHGGWWLPGRNNCRAATLGHKENYSGKQVGFRCCMTPVH